MTKLKALLFSALFLAPAVPALAAELVHNPVLVAAAGQDVQIQASLIGGSPDTRVRLFFRPKGKEIYRSTEMNGSVEDLNATVPGSAVDVAGFEYYLEADRAVNGVKSVVATSPAANPTLNPHSVVVRRDESGPEVVPLSPGSGDTVDSDHPVITAAWNDADSGVDISTVLVKIDGEAVKDKGAIQAFDTLVSYLPSASLANGEHEVTVVVKDKAGNPGAAKWSFTVRSGAIQTNTVKKSSWTVDGSASYVSEYSPVLSQDQPNASLPFRPYGVNRGTLSVNARGVSDTVSLNVYKTDEERSDQQPLDRYLASWKNRQGTVAVGDINPSFSELSLYGLNQLRGALFDLQSGPLNEGHTRMVGVWGQTQRAVEPGPTAFAGAPTAGTFAQYLYGARWEFGNPYLQLGMNSVTVNDDKDSITNSGGLSPHYNTLMSSDARIGIPALFLTLSGEAGSDFYAADTDPLGSAVGSAYKAAADLNILPWSTRLSFDFKDLGGGYGLLPGGYFNLANPGLLVDYRGYESSLSQGLFNNQFSLNVDLNHWHDNLQGQKPATTTTDFVSVFSSIAPANWPYLNVGYTQNLQANDADGNTSTGNLLLDLRTSVINLSLGMAKQFGELDNGSLNVSWVGTNVTDLAAKRLTQDLQYNNIALAALWAHELSSFGGSVGVGSSNQPLADPSSTALSSTALVAGSASDLSANIYWAQIWPKTPWSSSINLGMFNSSYERAATPATAFLPAQPKTEISSARSTLTVGGGYRIDGSQNLNASLSLGEVNAKSDPGVDSTAMQMQVYTRYGVTF